MKTNQETQKLCSDPHQMILFDEATQQLRMFNKNRTINPQITTINTHATLHVTSQQPWRTGGASCFQTDSSTRVWQVGAAGQNVLLTHEFPREFMQPVKCCSQQPAQYAWSVKRTHEAVLSFAQKQQQHTKAVIHTWTHTYVRAHMHKHVRTNTQ